MTDKKETAALKKLGAALAEIEELSRRATDGKWLERLTADCAPLIAEWDVREAWTWEEWPGRCHPDSGIDVVAKRADGELIAIQCKSRQLDEQGSGPPINKGEIDSFIAESSSIGVSFAERWLVVNGGVAVNANAERVVDGNKVAHINLYADIEKQHDGERSARLENCPHCEPGADGAAKQTRDCMQREAVQVSVAALKDHAQSGTGAARGRIILPCGTGKSRIALRLIEELTEPGHVSAILCPSIALVAQLRREFLIHGSRPLVALAVCSDQTAARGSDLSKDQAADLSRASARDVKGRVTTESGEIADWMGTLPEGCIGVIFGTYQSSHKIAEALTSSRTTLAVLVADEAHRTAGIRRVKGDNERLRDFTVCHHEQRFPATYRVYQTATPKIYKTPRERNAERRTKRPDWIVRSMDDENVFGPELYRKSYRDAVESGWLSDYRIIALGVNDPEAYQTANGLAGQKGSRLSTVQFLRGLALALVMGGATRKKEDGQVIRSSINFLNTVSKSKEMTRALESKTVREWVGGRLDGYGVREEPAVYRLQHLDADSNVAQREQAKALLAAATDSEPRGILNVGIFGEGTDAPSLSAVGFLEPRKSPVDVIQAVGRVMRRSEDKDTGYILCPIVIPPNVDAEGWLANTNNPDEGWQALGQILMALRAHDDRIEERLEDLMSVYLPPKPPEEQEVATVVAVGSETGRAAYYLHEGKQGGAERAVERVVKGTAPSSEEFRPLSEAMPEAPGGKPGTDGPAQAPRNEPHRIVTGKISRDGSVEMREQGVERDKPKSDGTPGPVNVKKTKATGRKMLNGESGRKILPRRGRTAEQLEELREQRTLNLLTASKADDMGIFVNLLEKSGLCRNKAQRSVNTLEEAIAEARLRLEEDELAAPLDAHFGLDKQSGTGKDSADGCTIASLLLMNAAMLHQRIAVGGWLPGVAGLDAIKVAPKAAQLALRHWNTITRHDFRPVLEPAIEVIWSVQDTGRESGLNKAMRHIAAEAERLAEDYSELGADYAGELFNKVMGNQASDGAYFTRPAAASLLARLALDAAAPDADWTDPRTWERSRMVDLACGSGTLLAATLTEMKRRARERGAGERELAELQKLAVEKSIVGLDFNPISLQLAAAQLTSGNADVTYRNMGLHQMPYGSKGDDVRGVRAGSLELLGQRRVISTGGDLDLGEQDVGSERLQMAHQDPTLEDAVDGALGARVVIMNPPFTNRGKMAEKFSEGIRRRLRERVDGLERALVQNDPELDGFVSKTSIGPLFEALAEKCADAADGVVAMVWPTIVFAGPAALRMRQIFAKRFHIHTLLTCHQPGDINLSQNTSINESLIVARRHEPWAGGGGGPGPPSGKKTREGCRGTKRRGADS
ncbi:MAG: DEAD/DEAH box helicase family protein, partial [Gammaproteobacteria bacterium]|nr:DEAD/DEAH box helicase family protein [Gammaproteobacteria bacterium]